MACASRTLVLLGLLVASFCVSANAGRELGETSKLDLQPLTNTVTGLLNSLLGSNGAILNLQFTIDLTSVSNPVVMAVQNGLGGTVPLTVAEGVTNRLTAPIPVAVGVDRSVRITVTIGGQETVVPVDLAQVVTAVNTATALVAVLVRAVESAANGVNTVALTNAAGAVLTTIQTTIPA